MMEWEHQGRGRVVPLRGVPWMTMAVAALAVAIWGAGAESLFIFDRQRVLAGEVWRLWTGNLVHFGWLHAAVDIGLLLILGCLLESQNRRYIAWSLAVIPWAVTLAVLVFDPRLAIYGGLSGLNFGWLISLALRGWQRSWTDWFWPLVVVLYVAELIQEAWIGHGMVRFDRPDIVVATWAHVGGGLAAAALFVAFAARDRKAVSRKAQGIRLRHGTIREVQQQTGLP